MLKQTLKNRLVIFSLIMSLAVGYIQIGPVEAVTEAELRARTDQLQQQISDNEDYLAGVEDRAQTLENRLAALQTEIDNAGKKIELSELKIKELKLELEKTIAELERQEGIVRESLRTLYKEGDLSTFELLLSADNFGAFFDEQEYLEQLKIAVQDSADQVAELKLEIETEKLREEKLLADLKQQKQVLADRRQEQREILERTRGEEAAYKQVLSELQEDLQEAQRDLEAFLAAQNFQSLGYVTAGTTIGFVGSTGFSTGPHLHFAIYDNGTFVNPYAGGMTYGMQWPLPTVSQSSISQVFGCVAPYYWYITKCGNGNSLHTGLDISAWYGEPIVAAGDGDIVYRGYLGGYGNAVIIDHGNGIQTYYAHMLD